MGMTTILSLIVVALWDYIDRKVGPIFPEENHISKASVTWNVASGQQHGRSRRAFAHRMERRRGHLGGAAGNNRVPPRKTAHT